MSLRMVFALDLIDDADLIAAYEARHAPGAVWPEVVQDIRLRGFEDMEIWRIDDRLVMIADVSSDYPRIAKSTLGPTVARWEREMERFQKVAPGKEKWQPLKRIFALTEQMDAT